MRRKLLSLRRIGVFLGLLRLVSVKYFFDFYISYRQGD
jgi:hypothetical protein